MSVCSREASNSTNISIAVVLVFAFVLRRSKKKAWLDYITTDHFYFAVIFILNVSKRLFDAFFLFAFRFIILQHIEYRPVSDVYNARLISIFKHEMA